MPVDQGEWRIMRPGEGAFARQPVCR
jgi:hypothetical protein